MRGGRRWPSRRRDCLISGLEPSATHHEQEQAERTLNQREKTGLYMEAGGCEWRSGTVADRCVLL